MANAIVSIVLERLTAKIEKQIREEVNLVRGVEKELVYLSSELNTIRNVLDDAERRRYKEKTIQNWLKKLENISYDVDDVLDEWDFALLKLEIEGSDNFVAPNHHKVCSLIPASCLCFSKVTARHDIAKKIMRLKSRLELILKEKDRYDFIVCRPVDDPRESDRVQSTSLIDVSEIHGRESDRDILVSKLVLEDDTQKEFASEVISIVGTGGIGKTTLAQLTYNDDWIKKCFNLRIWICVSNVFDEVRIARGIVENVKGSSPNLNELETLLKCVAEAISGRKFLLVLDDVWTENYNRWEPLKNSLKSGGTGSKILVTTRSERVARMMGATEIHRLGQLSDPDCWLLMREVAFYGKNEEDYKELQDVGRNIANKCKGLPLAAKVLGSFLRFKDTIKEWNIVLNSEIWQLEEAEVALFPHLFMSYNELSPTMKLCFSYCAVFPKDYEIDVEKLIHIWMALGYLSSNGSASDLEFRGREYFNNLAMRSFFQDIREFNSQVSCKMHDIVHDFAQFIRNLKGYDSEDSNGRSESRMEVSCQANSHLLVPKIKVYRSLFFQEELPPYIFDYMTRLRVLSLSKCELQEIPGEIENLTHLRFLDLSGNNVMARIPQTIFKLYKLQTLYLRKCGLIDIPREIGNLIHLRHLDLSLNAHLKELPETICNLHDLRTLNLEYCASLSSLPEGIHRLVNLRHLPNSYSQILHQIPQGLEQLTGLQILRSFCAGRGCSKLGYLNKLDQLSGFIELKIILHGMEDVIEAQKAEMRNKLHIHDLKIWFVNEMGTTDEEVSVKNDAMEALQPHPNLKRLTILDYQGTKFPEWITSPVNRLKVVKIQESNHCSTLPPFGKLPFLEELSVWRMNKMQFLSKQFLGIAEDTYASSSPTGVSPPLIIGFPKLRKLSFSNCHSWKEWEDVTAEELSLPIMPFLKELKIEDCGLMLLPHRLLLKASSLEHLTIQDCFHLTKQYEDKKGSGWKSLSHIPKVTVSYLKDQEFYRSYETSTPVFDG